MKIPLVRPTPPQLSLAIDELRSLEQSGVFSNFGPVNTLFEQEMLERFFGGRGACTTVCNATIGLMLAIKEAVGEAVGRAVGETAPRAEKGTVCPDAKLHLRRRGARGALVWADAALMRHQSTNLGG